MSEQKYRPDGRPDNEDSMNSPFGKLSTALAFIFIIGPIYLVMQAMWSCRRDEVKSHVENEQMDVLMLREATYYGGESHEKVENAVLAACKGLWDEGKPVVKLADGDDLVEWFAVDQSRYRASWPAPAFIERRTGKEELLGIENPSLSVVYAAFTSDPFNQARAWLKANGYSQSDFKLEWGYNNLDLISGSQETNSVHPRRGESLILLHGIFTTSMGYTWVWDGGTVTDVSEGDKYLRALSKAVRRIAK